MARRERDILEHAVRTIAEQAAITSVGALRRTTASNRHSMARVCQAQHRFSLRGSRR
jgi:hypothetical protein